MVVRQCDIGTVTLLTDNLSDLKRQHINGVARKCDIVSRLNDRLYHKLKEATCQCRHSHLIDRQSYRGYIILENRQHDVVAFIVTVISLTTSLTDLKRQQANVVVIQRDIVTVISLSAGLADFKGQQNQGLKWTVWYDYSYLDH